MHKTVNKNTWVQHFFNLTPNRVAPHSRKMKFSIKNVFYKFVCCVEDSLRKLCQSIDFLWPAFSRYKDGIRYSGIFYAVNITHTYSYRCIKWNLHSWFIWALVIGTCVEPTGAPEKKGLHFLISANPISFCYLIHFISEYLWGLPFISSPIIHTLDMLVPRFVNSLKSYQILRQLYWNLYEKSG